MSVLHTLHLFCSNLCIYPIIKIINQIPSSKITLPTSSVILILALATKVASDTLMVTALNIYSNLHGLMMVSYTILDILFDLSFSIQSIIIGVSASYIVELSTHSKDKDDVHMLITVYASLVSCTGPYLFSTLSFYTLQIILNIYDAFMFIECSNESGLEESFSIITNISFFTLLAFYLLATIYLCSTLHTCQNAFKTVAKRLR